jgi:tetratricopeptide (TPR) repeat protein
MKIFRIIVLFAVVFFTISANAQSIRETNYYPKLQTYINDIKKVRADIALQLTSDKRNLRDILVLEDRIEFKIKNQKTIINFSDILDDSIQVKVFAVMSVSNLLGEKITDPAIVNTIRRYMDSHLVIGKIDFVFKYTFNCNALADNLFFIQYKLKEQRYDAQITLFKPIAAQYCALKVKPPVSEEQRKFIVQANFLGQQKMYGKAIEVYKKAIEMDQTSYPAAYSNLALLSAQIQKFDAAIYFMKKYLMIMSDASDARSAQDKIYAWETQLSK